jgi:hypothetical protein
MTLQRQGFDPVTRVPENKYGINQIGEYIRVDVRNEYIGSELDSDNADGPHDIAYISLP